MILAQRESHGYEMDFYYERPRTQFHLLGELNEVVGLLSNIPNHLAWGERVSIPLLTSGFHVFRVKDMDAELVRFFEFAVKGGSGNPEMHIGAVFSCNGLDRFREILLSKLNAGLLEIEISSSFLRCLYPNSIELKFKILKESHKHSSELLENSRVNAYPKELEYMKDNLPTIEDYSGRFENLKFDLEP